jgi:NADH-quinone oxidoreductase subunit H
MVWNLFKMPVAALIFFIAMLAETNRLPFDLPETEAELVGGYHTEYGSLKFAMFFMGEYIAMVTMSGLFTLLFLGGPTLPVWIPPLTSSLPIALIGVGVFVSKVAVLLFIFMLIRWTLPRLRWTDLMSLGWKYLLPLSLLNLVIYSAMRLTMFGRSWGEKMIVVALANSMIAVLAWVLFLFVRSKGRRWVGDFGSAVTS